MSNFLLVAVLDGRRARENKRFVERMKEMSKTFPVRDDESKHGGQVLEYSDEAKGVISLKVRRSNGTYAALVTTQSGGTVVIEDIVGRLQALHAGLDNTEPEVYMKCACPDGKACGKQKEEKKTKQQ